MATNYNRNREFVISIENKPGAFAKVCEALGKQGVNVIGYACEAHGEFGTGRFVTTDAPKTEAWLRGTNYTWRYNDVLCCEAPPHEPGALGRLTLRFAQSGVNVNACYPCWPTAGSAPWFTFCVDDLQVAEKCLNG